MASSAIRLPVITPFRYCVLDTWNTASGLASDTLLRGISIGN